jgi:hypothetical protein
MRLRDELNDSSLTRSKAGVASRLRAAAEWRLIA